MTEIVPAPIIVTALFGRQDTAFFDAMRREHLFSWMLRNAESAMEFFRLPTNRVVELGSQVEI